MQLASRAFGRCKVGLNPPYGSHVDHTVVSIQHAFMHHFRQGRMRENGVNQVFFGGFQLSADYIALDQFGHFRADHMRAQQFACLGVEHGLDQTLGFAQGHGLAVADKGELARLDSIAEFLGLRLGIPH